MTPHGERPGARRPAVWPLSLGHGLNDGYGAFLSALLPLLISRFGMSLAAAGLLSSIRTSVASFGQLPLGALADRGRARWLVILGPAVTCAAMSLLGILPTYWAVAAALVAAGIGTAAFHPAGASLVSGGDGRRGMSMAVFSAGGTLGAALGPLLIAGVVGNLGLSFTPVLLLPAWALVLLLVRVVPREARPEKRDRPRLRTHPSAGQVVRLWTIGVLREFVSMSYYTFLAVLWIRRGASLTLASLALTVYSLSGVAGDLVGGRLSDRFGRKRVIVGSVAGAIPLFYLFLLTDGALSLLFLALAGAVLVASIPVSVVFGQELVPDQKGLVSGVLMGFAWGIGALLIGLVGYLGDVLGLEVALGLLTVLLVPATLLAAGLKEPHRNG
ncbi:MFS transporter [Candidatus Bipolaricaulota bacterium]|nr:MFS transporter [Candidatus Bipolaricaulota bacterium]